MVARWGQEVVAMDGLPFLQATHEFSRWILYLRRWSDALWYSLCDAASVCFLSLEFTTMNWVSDQLWVDSNDILGDGSTQPHSYSHVTRRRGRDGGERCGHDETWTSRDGFSPSPLWTSTMPSARQTRFALGFAHNTKEKDSVAVIQALRNWPTHSDWKLITKTHLAVTKSHFEGYPSHAS